ncbi:MAG: AAA family ATPase [Endomicrobiales bacterium]|nr:AAA family ATPase [Endomicrobiales bacterium]
MAKKLFIAATGSNVGKTSIALGLMYLLRKKYKRVGFIKPVSQRFVEVSKNKVGEDARLMKECFKLNYQLSDMNPVVVEKGLTTKHINGEIKISLENRIQHAYKQIEKDADLVLIEGSGHAGVGSVMGMSNAHVARMLDAKVILVCEGGIGRAVDKMSLDKALFEQKGCQIAGVVVNKVLQTKYQKISGLLKKWFNKNKIPLCGILPYSSCLSVPSLFTIAKEIKAVVENGEKYLEQNVEKIIVGAMQPDTLLDILKSIDQKILLIASSDRVDILTAVLSKCHANNNIAGILLSGNRELPESIKDILKIVNMPILRADKDVYELASQVHELTTKITIRDTNKIKTLYELVEEYMDIDAINESL